MLFEQGGLYLDTDYKLLDFPARYRAAECLLPIETGALASQAAPDDDARAFRLGNAFLGSMAGHGFWQGLIEDIFAPPTMDALNGTDPIVATGPIALTRFWQRHASRYPGIVLPAKQEFYPDLRLSRLGAAKTRDTLGVHLCWGSWRGKKSLQHYRNVVRRKITCLT